MRRRNFITALSALGAIHWATRPSARPVSTDPNIDRLRKEWRRLLPAEADVALDPSPLERSAPEWRKRLPADSYAVLFDEDTEPPFSSPLNLEKRAGVFVCRACRLPLFTSEMKFESGTGWPSFFTVIPGHYATRKDFRLLLPRTEYHCAKCGGHQGHVFDDGPAPTGERWCNNGLALAFIPSGRAG